jgi:hypothetical protein
MSINTVLLLKVIWVLFEGFLVVRMGVNFVGSCEVFNLSDAQFPIAYLSVHKPWFLVVRIFVFVSCYNVMSH